MKGNLTFDEPELKDFSTFRHFLSCSNVLDIEFEYRCEYVLNTTECQERKFFVSYIEILYCYLKPATTVQLYAYLVLFLCLCLVIFTILGTTADRFFCPSLEMLSKAMGLSEHLAGITLLAFGNGSADLFTTLAGFDNSTMTLYSNLLGAAIYISAFVGGLICIVRPFHITGSSLLRDTTFFIFGLWYIDYAVESNGYVTRLESIFILSIYFIYLAVILIDQYLVRQSVQNMEKLMQRGRMSVVKYKEYTVLRKEASIDILSPSSRTTLNVDATRTSFYGYEAGENFKLFQQLFESLNPIDEAEWSEGGCFKKTLICLKAPIIIVLTLFIPQANYELQRHGWSKLLNCLQVITLPLFTAQLIFQSNTWLGFPIYCYTLLLTIPLSVLAFKNTRTDRSPGFHVYFAFLSAFGSMLFIYACASEVVEIMFILGLVMNCSNSFLGCTLLAWGNGVGDLISNLSLAMHGYQKMAFAACYGGPFFNNLVCMGFMLVIKTFQSENGRVSMPLGPLGDNCFIFMSIVLFSTLMWSVTTNFHLRRSVGIFSLLIYALFVLYTVLSELEIIETYAELSEYSFNTP